MALCRCTTESKRNRLTFLVRVHRFDRMSKPQTISELYDFFAAIPETDWNKYSLVGEGRRRCANGHIATRMLGINLFSTDWKDVYRQVNSEVLEPLGLTATELFQVNDNHGSSARENVLCFLAQREMRA